MGIGERISKLIEYKGVTPYIVSQNTGISQATLSRILNNSTAKPSQGTIQLLAKYFDSSLDWILTGRGEMLCENKSELRQTSNGIPFYDMDVTAGITESFADVREEVQYYINYPPLNDCDAAFPVYGDSMEPDFYPGDVVLVREIRNVDSMLWGEPYLIITDATCDNLRTIKNVYLSEDRRSFILRATNPKYSGDTIVLRDNVLKIFLVKGKVTRRQL